MKISASSSMLLATLAVSSSNPCLAAPTGDVPDSGLTSSSSNAHIASRRSSVSYPQPETSDLERRGGLPDLACCVIQKLPAIVPPPLDNLVGTLVGPLAGILGCPPNDSLETRLTPEQLAAVDNFAQVVAAAVQSPQSSDHLSPSSDTPPAPPNTPDVSSQPAQTPTAQRREPHFFARRGVGAPPVSPRSVPATPPAASNPVAVAGQPAAAVPAAAVPGVPNSVPSVGNSQSPLPAAAPPTNPTDARGGQPHPQPPVDSKAQTPTPPPTPRARSSRALPKTSDVRQPSPPGVPRLHPQTQVNMDPLHSRDLPATPLNLPASSPQVPGAPVPQSASGLPVNPAPVSPPGIPAVPQAASPPGGVPAVLQPAPAVPVQQPGMVPKIVSQPQAASSRRSEPEVDDEDCDDDDE